jgi:hypothetical protein
MTMTATPHFFVVMNKREHLSYSFGWCIASNMADEKAHEAVVLLDTIDLTRAKNKGSVTIGGGVPRKDDDDEDEHDVENVDDSSELAVGVPMDVYGDTKQGNKVQQPQQRKRHGARNQHKMKHFVRWLLETFPDILVHPPSASSAAPLQRGSEKNTPSSTICKSSCCCDARQQVTQKEETAKVASSRTETNSSSCYTENAYEVPPSPPPPPLILDVAGGKGELAARLCLCNHLRVVLVDPRPANIAQTYQQTVVPRLPQKWQARLRQRLATNPNHVQDMLNNQFHQVVDYFSYQVATTTVVWNNDEHDEDYTKQQQRQQNVLRLQQAVQDASLLIGMHADGATEDIIDVALHYHKPFVVVPCCVFANLYSHRQVRHVGDVEPDDKTATTTTTTSVTEEEEEPPKLETLHVLPEMTFASVRTHEQFCQYLLDKDARFQKSILPFAGRNVAIWWNGK